MGVELLNAGYENSFGFALSRRCHRCGGIGKVDPYCAATAENNNSTMGMPVSSQSIPLGMPCPDCMSGWVFRRIEHHELIALLAEELIEHLEKKDLYLLRKRWIDLGITDAEMHATGKSAHELRAKP